MTDMDWCVLKEDIRRYGSWRYMPAFQYSWRLAQITPPIISLIFKVLHRFLSSRRFVELSHHVKCGPGLYIGHPYCIVVNPDSVIGSHVNLSKNVTIGQDNRGSRKGVPVIGNRVWIGVNATVVGKITIGDDVLIAPNTFVNVDVPSHSVVYGNPCIIKHRDNATECFL